MRFKIKINFALKFSPYFMAVFKFLFMAAIPLPIALTSHLRFFETRNRHVLFSEGKEANQKTNCRHSIHDQEIGYYCLASPVFTIEAPVLNSFCQVLNQNILLAGKIGYGSGYTKNTVVCPGRKPEFFHCCF